MQYKWLELKIKDWMRHVGTPKPELNGWAPCPFVLTYMDKISIVIVEQGIKQPIEQAFQMLEPLKLKGIVLAFPKKPNHGQIQKTCDQLLNQPEYEHIECLLVNHKLRGEYRGIYTGFNKCDLVIVQNQHQLKWARNNLKQRGYYEAR